MSTITLGDLTARHGVNVLDHLDRQVAVPVLTGLQVQGDVAVIPTTAARVPAGGVTVPAAGVPVVRGENGGNTHLLLADGGDVTWTATPTVDATALTLGWVTVPDGATAYLAHPEHGYAGVGAGVFEVRRQREQAEQIRLVAD